MKVRGDSLGPPLSIDKTTLIIKVRKTVKIRKRYNQVPHLTQDTTSPFFLKKWKRYLTNSDILTKGIRADEKDGILFDSIFRKPVLI